MLAYVYYGLSVQTLIDLFQKDSGSAIYFSVFPSSIVLESQGAGSDIGFLGYVLPKTSAIDIDDEQDWKLAEAIYSAKASRFAD